MMMNDAEWPAVGVVGCGDHAVDVLVPSLRAAGFRIASVCARTAGFARRVAALHGIDRAHDDVTALAADPDIDAIVVAVPPDQMEPVLDVALRVGKPVYIEKPAAADEGAARRLSALATAESATTLVGYMKRFAPAYVGLADLMGTGSLGRPSLIRVRWAMGPFDRRPLDDWFLENAVHAIDLARWLGGDIGDLHARITTLEHQHVVLADGVGRNGVAVSLAMTTTGPWWSDNEEVEVFGMGSTARVRNAVELVHTGPNGVEHRTAPNFTIPVRRNATTTLAGFVPALEVFRAVVEGASSPYSLQEAVATLELAAEILVRAGCR
jgi:predicted dehydrogenase